MTESEFAQILQAYLTRELAGFEVATKEALLYKVIVDGEGDYRPRDPKNPVRGNLAFETDLLIKRDGLPLVVCELKYGGFSTHDVMIYSTKGIRYKEVYPYLRYGFVCGNTGTLSNKFFTHNVGFDFAMAMPGEQPAREALAQLRKLVKTQIKSALQLLDLLRNGRGGNTMVFNASLKISDEFEAI